MFSLVFMRLRKRRNVGSHPEKETNGRWHMGIPAKLAYNCLIFMVSHIKFRLWLQSIAWGSNSHAEPIFHKILQLYTVSDLQGQWWLGRKTSRGCFLSQSQFVLPSHSLNCKLVGCLVMLWPHPSIYISLHVKWWEKGVLTVHFKTQPVMAKALLWVGESWEWPGPSWSCWEPLCHDPYTYHIVHQEGRPSSRRWKEARLSRQSITSE